MCLRYNRLFQQLLTYRLATFELQRLQLGRDASRHQWAFKAQLSFFLSQVMDFFLQDVVEASHQELLHRVDASVTFHELLRAHEAQSNAFCLQII